MPFPIQRHEKHISCFGDLILVSVKVFKNINDLLQVIVLVQDFDKFHFPLITQAEVVSQLLIACRNNTSSDKDIVKGLK